MYRKFLNTQVIYYVPEKLTTDSCSQKVKTIRGIENCRPYKSNILNSLESTYNVI